MKEEAEKLEAPKFGVEVEEITEDTGRNSIDGVEERSHSGTAAYKKLLHQTR